MEKSYSKITADYVVSKFRNKKQTKPFVEYILKLGKQDEEFSKEMSKIRFKWVGRYEKSEK